ncbi:BnaC03g66230D [Brassica napus]|uniref:(rape) hypothetical protein n=1 Tax=Brassica napus TaxID=3708 RepID=A0A078I825_BRANA|nr:unnamed protein product [Brassica napus]CDY46262.1 BnaC03g66230D [Brassica napus]
MVRAVTREPRGIRKPRPVSPEMKDVVGESVIPRRLAHRLSSAFGPTSRNTTFK